MLTKLFLFLSVLLALTFAATPLSEEDDLILVLNSTNFDSAIAEHEFIMVEFYAPWCGHCKKFAPEYIKIAKTLKNSSIPITLAKVDGATEKNLTSQFKIASFPTLVFFIKGMQIIYDGNRAEDTLIKWMQNKIQPAVREVKTQEELEKARKEYNVVVVLWRNESHPDFAVYKDVSKSFEEVAFLYTGDQELKSKYSSDESLKVTLFKTFDDGREDYNKEINQEILEKLIKDHEFPAVVLFENKFAKKVFLEFQPTIIVVAGANMESDWAIQALNEVRPALRGKILMTYTYYPEGGELTEKLVEYLSVNTKELPALRIINPIHDASPKKYASYAEITAENLLKFYEDWKNGKIDEIPKSQYIPNELIEDCKVLTTDNYHHIVFDNNKDVLVETHALSCVECKKLTPIVESIAKEVSHIPDLIISKFDIVANDLKEVDRKLVPALRLYRRNDKQNPVLYKGDIDQTKILEWLKENTTLEWTDKKPQKQGQTKPKAKSQDL